MKIVKRFFQAIVRRIRILPNNIYRARIARKCKRFGASSCISRCTILYPQLVEVGEDVRINVGCHINGRGGVVIGDHSTPYQLEAILSAAAMIWGTGLIISGYMFRSR